MTHSPDAFSPLRSCDGADDAQRYPDGIKSAASAAADILDDPERLHEADQHQQILDTIEVELRTTSNRSQRAELPWRRNDRAVIAMRRSN